MAEETSESRLIWFVAGAAIGATVALLLAPESGRDTRKRLTRGAADGRKAMMEAGQEIADRSRDLYEKGRKIADEAAEIFDKGRKMVQG